MMLAAVSLGWVGSVGYQYQLIACLNGVNSGGEVRQAPRAGPEAGCRRSRVEVCVEVPSAEAALGQQREKSTGMAEKLMLKDNHEGSTATSKPGWVDVTRPVLKVPGTIAGWSGGELEEAELVLCGELRSIRRGNGSERLG